MYHYFHTLPPSIMFHLQSKSSSTSLPTSNTAFSHQFLEDTILWRAFASSLSSHFDNTLALQEIPRYTTSFLRANALPHKHKPYVLCMRINNIIIFKGMHASNWISHTCTTNRINDNDKHWFYGHRTKIIEESESLS